MAALEPLSDFPNTAGVGGTQWKRATAIGSDLFEKCPGRAFIRNVTEYAPGWRCQYQIIPCSRENNEPTSILYTDRFNAIIPAQLAQAPYQGSKLSPLRHQPFFLAFLICYTLTLSLTLLTNQSSTPPKSPTSSAPA
jgi:hypothetical protein